MFFRTRSLFSTLLLPLLSVAAVQGDDPRGDWLFMDINKSAKLPAPNEVSVAKKLAAPDKVHVFSDTKGLEEWLKANPNQRVSTLVVSGHSSGESFMLPVEPVTGQVVAPEFFMFTTLERLAKEHPQLGASTAFYAMGCYTGVQSNAKLWMRSQPGMKLFVGFDGLGPSDEPAAQFLAKAEGARRSLPSAPTLSELSAALKSSKSLAETAGALLVRGTDNRGSFASNASAAEVFSLELRTREACLADFEILRKKVEGGNIYSLIHSYLPHRNFGEKKNGILPLLVVPTTEPSDAKVSDMRPLDAKNTAELREVYRLYQDFTDCPTEVFSEAKDLFPDDYAMMQSGIRGQLVALIHGEQSARNSIVCFRPIMRSATAYLRRCGNTPETESLLGILDRLGGPAAPKAARTDMAKFVDGSAVFLDAKRVPLKNLQKVNFILMRMLDVGLGTPPQFWLDPIVAPEDERCRLHHAWKMNELISADLDSAACDGSFKFISDEQLAKMEKAQNPSEPAPAPEPSPSPAPFLELTPLQRMVGPHGVETIFGR